MRGQIRTTEYELAVEHMRATTNGTAGWRRSDDKDLGFAGGGFFVGPGPALGYFGYINIGKLGFIGAGFEPQ